MPYYEDEMPDNDIPLEGYDEPPEEYPENDYPEDDYPEDSIDDGRCGDPECDECYPQENVYEDEGTQGRIVGGIPDFSTTSSTSSPIINFNTVNSLQDDINRITELIREGDEVPENNPEVTPEEPRQVTIPSIPGVNFSTARGSGLRPNRIVQPSTILTGMVVQFNLWDYEPETIRENFSAFRSWLEENELAISSASTDVFEEGSYSIPVNYYFIVVKNDHRNARPLDQFLSQPPCNCGHELQYPSAVCPECESPCYCTICRRFSTGVGRHPEFGYYCDTCSVSCDECASQFPNNAVECPTCVPRHRCYSCNDMLYEGRHTIHEYAMPDSETSNHYCDRCFEGLCHSCGSIVDPLNILEDEGHRCVGCVSRNNFEEWSDDSLDSEQIMIPTIPGRETIRMVGIEIEGANGEGINGNEGGQILARSLYNEGISAAHSMGGYHSSSGRRMTVHVERDSSVDWELVIGPMNVANRGEVELMNRSVRIVRRFINDGTLRLDMRAGMHIHVGADRVPFHNAYNLHKLYMYMEDFLYRFGAAKWPYHRSINRRNTRDQAGKSPIAEGKLHFARTFAGNRYYGLSFDNYFSRYFEGCACGARTYGLFDECTCDLGKCTFEFRLFNTTANTVKIHAYLAMCQAIVAKAIELDEIKDTKAYPALDFTSQKLSDHHPSTRNKLIREWEKRIVFINEQLPLTPEEKRSIHYCIMNSEMGKVVTNADILIETEDN